MLRKLQRLTDRLELFLSKVEHVDGLWVGTLGDLPNAAALKRLQEALSLIKTYDHTQYTRVLHNLKRVWALRLEYPVGCFNPRLDACQINLRVVLAETTTPEILASVIVHEATHARLWRYGYAEQLRPRIEAICVRRELAFSAKLPNGQAMREAAEQRPASNGAAASLSDAALTEQYEDGAAQALRELGMPQWVIRIVFALRGVLNAVRGTKRPT